MQWLAATQKWTTSWTGSSRGVSDNGARLVWPGVETLHPTSLADNTGHAGRPAPKDGTHKLKRVGP